LNEIQKAVFVISSEVTSLIVVVVRHCLWIVGNGMTLSNSKSVWQKIVSDARVRGCYFDANEDKDLSNAVMKAIIELDDAENLVKMDSLHISRPRFQVLPEFFSKLMPFSRIHHVNAYHFNR
jgi:senataxin